MKGFCQFCGSIVSFNYPYSGNQRYSIKYHSKPRKAYKEDEKFEKNLVIEYRNIKGFETKCVVGEWIGKNPQPNFSAICGCGKMVYAPAIKESKKSIPAFRSDLCTKKQINVYLTEFHLYEFGVHIEPIKTSIKEAPIVKGLSQLSLYFN